MVGFFNLFSDRPADQKIVGNAIIRLCRSVNQTTPNSEWMKFKADPKAWLHKAGYRYDGPGAGPNGEIPAAVKIVPVVDTEDTMHVRVPWKGLVENPPMFREDGAYPVTNPDRFAVGLARYFMRHCR